MRFPFSFSALHKLILCGFAFVALLLFPLDQVAGNANGENQAAIVIQYGDGSVTTHCVSFSGAEITGQELLEQAKLDIEIAYNAGKGAAVCRIGPDGCPANDCFCQDPPDYWSYWHLIENEWRYSQVGLSSWAVQPGTMDAWVWGSGEPPPSISFETICTSTESATSDMLSSTATTSLSTPTSDTSKFLTKGWVLGVVVLVISLAVAYFTMQRNK